VLLVFGAPCQVRLLAGQEHGRTIPLTDIALDQLLCPVGATSGRAHNLVASIEVGSFWREERKSDRQPYPGRRPMIALACASIETRPLASIGTCSRTRDLSCVTSAVAIVVSIGARLGAAIVVDQ
jgi:hypothetical protein